MRLTWTHQRNTESDRSLLREQAKENSQKYVGVSSDDARSGGRQKQGGFSSTGFGSTGFGSGSGSSSKLDSDFSSKLKFGGDAREAPVRQLASCRTAFLNGLSRLLTGWLLCSR